MLHHIYLLLQSGHLHTAPISEPQKVLDLGTGTGIWALDFAEFVFRALYTLKLLTVCSEFPGSEVLGISNSDTLFRPQPNHKLYRHRS